MNNQSKGFYLFFAGYVLFAMGVYYMAQEQSSIGFYANLAIAGLIIVAFLYFEQGRSQKVYSVLIQGLVYAAYLGTYALFLFKASQKDIAKAILSV